MSLSWGGFIISHTPAFEGQVTDTETGKPIPYAIVEVQWYRTYVFGLENRGTTMGKPLLAATDSDGHYRIRGKWSFWTPRGLDGFRIWVRHPLYEGHDLSRNHPELHREFRKTHKRDSKLVYDVGLKKRDEKSKLLGIGIKTSSGRMTVAEEDLKYFRAATKIKIDFKKTVLDWDSYSKKKEIMGIMEVLHNK